MTDRTDAHAKSADVDPGDPHATCAAQSDDGATERTSGVAETDFNDPFATFVPAAGREIAGGPARYDALVRGDQIGDFRVQRLLGRGSFGAVYLARDLTLDRLVAVKVVLPEGQRASAGEGRSLARLKHPNIVGVFGEAHDRASGCCLLWMQFVEGCNLAALIEHLYSQQRGGDWTEFDLLRFLNPDREFTDQERRVFASRGSLETIYRIGHRLSEALSHAHASGVTHRDIKPANILMQRDGTPLLADFNLADNASDTREKDAGGTIAYMSPEQLASFLGGDLRYNACRGDIYSLGVVLWELACGSRPFAEQEASVTSGGVQQLQDLLTVRRNETPSAQAAIPLGLEIVLRRAMAANPQQRYPSARAMATALKGLEELERARRRAPSIDRIRRFVRRNLFWIILIGGILPHVAASIFQSAYNLIWIGTSDDSFTKAFILYNVVVYPACVGWLAWNLYRFAQGYRRVVAYETFPRGQLRKLRRRLLRLPRQFMIAAAVGWFPGVILFPWLLGMFGVPPTAHDWFHYGISFLIAGMIATTYSYAFVLYVAVCHGYRACWQTASHYRERARLELAGMEKRIRLVSILVGVLPLGAAVLLLAIGMPSLDEPDANSAAQMRDSHRLLIALIVAGAIGLYVVETASARLIRCVRALTLADE